MRIRNLARKFYFLNDLSITNHLPYIKLNQGYDIIMIMKNIHIFAENYNYDLNEQVCIFFNL